MIFIITLLFYLYIVVVVLTIATLLLITPILMEKLPWKNDKKVLTILPLYLFFIPLAVISIWKFQDWKVDYETRTGHAKISTKYQNFLEYKYPQLGKMYQKVIADHFILQEHLRHTYYQSATLKNHAAFIKNITQRRRMILDQLVQLRQMLEKEALRKNDSPNAAAVLKNHIDFYLKKKKKNRASIQRLMHQHAENSIRFLSNPRSSVTHYPINKQNYEQIIHFFVSRFDDDESNLIALLDVIVQTIYRSKQIIQQLSKKLAQKKLRNRAIIREVLQAWQGIHRYSYHRLFKILYALEAEYVLQKMNLQKNHSSMQQLHTAINQAIPYYSQNVSAFLVEVEQSNNLSTALTLH